MKAPEPGIYASVPEADYRKWDAINYSALKCGARSMRHVQHALCEQSESSESMVLGTALDMYVLDPPAFGRRVCVAPDVDRRTKAGKAEWESFCVENAGRLIITMEQLETVQKMATALRRHSSAARLLAAQGHTQTCAVWRDIQTGMLCKGRLDKFIPGKLIFDLKTTRDASPRGFGRAVAEYGYHMQMAWYGDGYRTASGGFELPIEEPLLLAVENEAPWGVAVYRLDDAAMRAGSERMERLLAMYAEARRVNRWDGYSDDVQTLSVPKWALGMGDLE